MAARIADHIEKAEYLAEPQYGFRKNRSTTDQMLTLELLSQIQKSRGQEFHIIHIDLQKAFENVNREMLFDILEETGIDQTLSDLLKSAYQ